MPPGLKLRLAFQRVRDELLDQPKSGRALAANQFELNLIELAYDDWVRDLAKVVKNDTYSPGPVEYCNAPKAGGLVRPGVRMLISDRVIYTAAVGACLRSIYEATRWSQKRIDFATPINGNGLSKRQWLRSPFVGWDGYRRQSVRLLARAGTEYVVTADIAGYFENVSIAMLASDLARIDCRPDVISLLGQCLNQWAPTPDRSLPQGVLASDVLAKLYLEPFDRHLKALGFAHVRYADDIRIFCRSQRQARRALVVLTELLRERGLTLQSAKTQIRSASGLVDEFEGAVPAIQALQRDYVVDKKLRGQLVGDPSIPISAIDDLASTDPSAIDPKVIRRAFRKFVVRASSPNQTMRRYLLRRLVARQDDTAVDYCSELILRQPETSTEVLRYFEDLSDPARFERPLVRVLKDADIGMYHYQQYLILDWLWRNSSKLRKPTVAKIRKIEADAGIPAYVRMVATALLGKFGDHADWERIASTFTKSSDPLERAQLLSSLTRLERGRRNAILGRVQGERPWVDRAVKLVKAQS